MRDERDEDELRDAAPADEAAADTALAGAVDVDLEEVRRTGHNPLPLRFLQIETSSECNFRCASCALSLADYDRPERHMTAEQFRRVLESFPTVEKIELQGVGEVFLNAAIFDLIREATDRGVRVHTFSNASKIERSTARAIVDSGLELINFSMDGADEPTFKKLRKGGTLKRYRRCVSNLIEARATSDGKTPTIGVMSVLSKANYRQAPQMIAIAEELGVDHLIFTKLNAGPKADQVPLLLGAEELAWLDALPPYVGPVEVVWAYNAWTREERMDCYWPKSMSYVTVDGDVTPCCNYYDSREIKLGNVFEQDGAEIWNSEAYKEFRRELLAGRLPSKCQTC
ncbi:MAG: radical SAM protein [Planctomycetota bacterium]